MHIEDLPPFSIHRERHYDLKFADVQQQQIFLQLLIRWAPDLREFYNDLEFSASEWRNLGTILKVKKIRAVDYFTSQKSLQQICAKGGCRRYPEWNISAT